MSGRKQRGMKGRIAGADIEAAFSLGRRSALKPEWRGRVPWAVRVAGDKARRQMATVGSLRGMLCRVAYHRGRREGERQNRYGMLWEAAQAPVSAKGGAK